MRAVIRRSAIAVMLLTIAASVLMPNQAAAQLSIQQKNLYKDGIYYFNYDDDVCTANAEGNFTVVPGDNAKTAYLFFLSKGLTPEEVVAIIGTLAQESGGLKLDPKIHQIGGGKGRGIAQWSVDGRWVTLTKWAAERVPPMDPWTIQTQLEFVWKELHDDNYNGSWDSFKAAPGLDAKVHALTDDYEQAGAKEYGKRIEFAKQALRMYGNSTPGSADSTNLGEAADGGCQNINNGLATVVDGFAFPLIATKKQIRENPTARWCWKNQKNCHHHYNAADIHMPTGTTIVAAKPGIVIKVKRKDAAANNVLIKGENGDNHIYFYQHMGRNTPQVSEGQPVVAGQPIGKIGDSVDAFDTDPHLHFDMLPSPPFNGRVDCASATCMGYPFVDVQPILYNVFQSLPE